MPPKRNTRKETPGSPGSPKRAKKEEKSDSSMQMPTIYHQLMGRPANPAGLPLSHSTETKMKGYLTRNKTTQSSKERVDPEFIESSRGQWKLSPCEEDNANVFGDIISALRDTPLGQNKSSAQLDKCI